MGDNYIRHPDGSLEKCEDIIEYAAWFETADRQIARTAVPYRPDNKKAVIVSTVFLGINHGWDGTAILFETVTFDMPDESELGQRYETEEQARGGHKDIVCQVEMFLVEYQKLHGFSEEFQAIVTGKPQKIPPPKPRKIPLPNKPPQSSCSACSGLGTIVNAFGMPVACDCTL